MTSKRREPGYVFARSILLPWLRYMFRFHVEGLEFIPSEGPVIIAVNHISLFDPLAVAWVIDQNARRHPRFFGKASLFDAPVVGWILRSAGQIRVDRGTATAPSSLVHAEEALEQSQVVVIFPEGTTTIDPDLVPLPPKSGMARLALKTKVPVIPCATWGGQWIWSYFVGFKPGYRPWRRKDVWVRFGAPIAVDNRGVRSEDPSAWDAFSKVVMDEIVVLTAGLRAAKPWTTHPLKKRSRPRTHAGAPDET